MKFLIVVDMQNDFIDGALGTPEAQAIVPAVCERIRQAEANREFIIFTRDTHFIKSISYGDYYDTLEGQKLPVSHCIKDTYGWKISSKIEEEAFQNGNRQYFDKFTFGMYTLPDIIDELARDYEDTIFADEKNQITLIGLCTDICVISNAMIVKAAYPNTPIIVEKNCCAGVTPESHENALKAMAMCHIDII